MIHHMLSPDQQFTVQLKPGPVQFLRRLTPDQWRILHQTTIHLPSARLRLADGFEKDLVESVLTRAGWPLENLRIRYPRDTFFSRAKRQAAVPVSELEWNVDTDETEPGQQKLTLSFGLPRGSYATMLVKRISPRSGFCRLHELIVTPHNAVRLASLFPGPVSGYDFECPSETTTKDIVCLHLK